MGVSEVAEQRGRSMIETRAAVLTATGGDWETCDLRLDGPRAGEVLVRLAYAGLCYSDEHVRFDSGARLPIVGGHEGSGVVVETGPGVTGDRKSTRLNS